MRITRWHLVFALVAGFFLGAVVVSIATPDRSNDAEIRSIELDVNRNSEKILQLQREVGSIFEWISASDRQKIKDAEIEGEAHSKIEFHEKLAWLVLGQGIVVMGLVLEWIVRRKRNGK
jgi:hypothetical protein